MRWHHLFNWLPSRTVRRTRHARTPRPRWRFAQPRLEALEDRTLLTTIILNPGQSIQAAVNGAASGDTILLNPGTYTQQVTINKSLTLQGNGAGAIIQSPTALTNDSFGLSVLVEVNSGATVNINNMTVEGPGAPASPNNTLVGIGVFGGATANLTGDTINQINLGSGLFGLQTGFAIQVGGTGAQAVGQVGNATITDCTITDYQKVGVIIGNSGSSGTITGNTITGIGPTPLTAQNGIQISPGSASATVSNNTISGNEFTGTGSGPDPTVDQQAVGILNFINGCIITGNTVFGNDEGIFSTNTGTTATTISGNTVENNRFQGILLSSGTATVSNNTITGNNIGVAIRASANSVNAQGTLISNNITNNGNGGAGFPGGGIVLLQVAGVTGTPVATANFNRIVGNSVGLDNSRVAQAAPVDATDNWWGSNAGPGGAGSDTVSGPVDFNPWLLLQVTASPNTLLPGGVATVIADLTKNSSGEDTSALGHVPDGIPVSFADALGTISPTASTTVAGKATATFTAGNTPGIATVFATVDNQTSSALITIEPATTTIQLTTLHIVPNLLNLTAQVTMTAQVSNPAGTVNGGVVTFTLAGVSVQGTVQNGTANAQVVIPLIDLASNLAVQLSIPSTYADNSTPVIFGPGSAVTPVVFNIWNALLPSTVTLTGGGEQNVIPFFFTALQFSYVNQVWTAFHFGPLALQVQYITFGDITVLTLNGFPQQVLFFAAPSQFLGAVTLALSDVVPTLMANTSGPQFLDAVLMALSGSGGPTLLLSDAFWQLAGTVPL
jgi:parallel beta-helix repeat protein